MRILGVDPSLTGTGIACLQLGSHPKLDLIRTTGKATDTDVMKVQRMARIVGQICGHCTYADLVVIEGLSYGSMGGSTRDLAGLWFLTLDALVVESGMRLAVCPPSVLKKWATGKGNAGKPAVAMSMARLWPSLWGDEDYPDDNRVDALALATMGAQHAGLEVPSLARHAESLTKVQWPEAAAE